MEGYFTKMELGKVMNSREALVAYMKTKIDEEDWHAVSDAANDLRELDVVLEFLEEANEKS